MRPKIRALIEQNEETVEPSENVSFKKVKSLVDYELEEEEELKDSDDIVDNKNKKMEEEGEGEILSVQNIEEKQLIDDQNNFNKVNIDVCPNQDSLSSLKWLSYTVQNIPESIRVCTLLRQFLCPKPYGTVIQKSQLNMDFLQTFILESKQIINPPNNSDKNKDFGSSQLHIYSEVALPLGNEDDEIKSENDCQSDAELRYYPVNPQQTILENLRNRYVVGHPCFAVLLRRENEFGEFEFPTMGEAEQALLNAERERIVTIKDRPRWQNRNGNGGGRGFRGGQFNNKSRQHGRNGGRRGGQQHMTEHNNRPSIASNSQWQQQPSNGPIYNNYSSSNNQHHQYHHFHPYMPSTFVPQAPYPNQGLSRWNGQGGGNRGNEFRR